MPTEFYKMICLVLMSTLPLQLPCVDAAITAAAPCRCRHRCRSPVSMPPSLQQPHVDAAIVAAAPCRRPRCHNPMLMLSLPYVSYNIFQRHDLNYLVQNNMIETARLYLIATENYI